MKQKSVIAVLIFLSLAVSFSCSKNETTTTEPASTQDELLTQWVFNNVTAIADEAYDLTATTTKNGDAGVGIIGPCATISLDTLAFPATLTIDFGPVNCLCDDGRYRRGVIKVNFTGYYRAPGTVISTSFQDYYVNDNHIEGTKVVTNMGLNDMDQLWYTVEVDGRVTKAVNGAVVDWTASHVRTWVAGADTYLLSDDVYTVDGSSEGSSSLGNQWVTVIGTPLTVELSCRWIVAGDFTTTPTSGPEFSVDFGDGSCDNMAILTVLGTTIQIYLP